MKAIATMRTQANMSRAQLAMKLNVSQQAIMKWEKGVGYPTADKLPILAQIFGCTIDELFNDNNTEKETA